MSRRIVHAFDCRAWLETARLTIATSWTYGLAWRLRALHARQDGGDLRLFR